MNTKGNSLYKEKVKQKKEDRLFREKQLVKEVEPSNHKNKQLQLIKKYYLKDYPEVMEYL